MGTVQLDGYLLKYSPPKGKVKIGGRVYPTVRIGNQWWMSENLDWKFDGLVVGNSSSSDTVPYANYLQDDEATYGVNGTKDGLLYNFASGVYLNEHASTLLPSGWHVPSKNELITMVNYAGDGGFTDKAYNRLIASGGWNVDGQWDGAGPYYFKFLKSGFYNDLYYYGNQGYIWSCTETINNRAHAIQIENAIYNSERRDKNSKYSIRLVKDA